MQTKIISIHSVNMSEQDCSDAPITNLTTPVEHTDVVTIEEPLHVVLKSYSDQIESKTTTVMTTMRTPGHDIELVTGWLKTQTFIHSEEVTSISHPTNIEHHADGSDVDQSGPEQNLVIIKAKPHFRLNIESLTRFSSISSSCGICGDTALDNLTANSRVGPLSRLTFSCATLQAVIAKATEAADLFNATGGSHSSAAFLIKNDELTSSLLAIREDVGRHNALDKLTGALSQQQLNQTAVLLSGRVSADLMQKVVCSGIPLVLSVGAPSNLAIEMAESEGVILIGFIRVSKFNIYAGLTQTNFIGTDPHD